MRQNEAREPYWVTIYHSFGCPKTKFRPLTEAVPKSQWWSLIFSCELGLEVTQSHVTRLGPEAWPSPQWGYEQGTFQFGMQHLKQGFSNSIKGRGKPRLIGGNRKFCWGIFFIGWWETIKEWFWPFESFSRLKTTFFKYRTSIKIKM